MDDDTLDNEINKLPKSGCYDDNHRDLKRDLAEPIYEDERHLKKEEMQQLINPIQEYIRSIKNSMSIKDFVTWINLDFREIKECENQNERNGKKSEKKNYINVYKNVLALRKKTQTGCVVTEVPNSGTVLRDIRKSGTPVLEQPVSQSVIAEQPLNQPLASEQPFNQPLASEEPFNQPLVSEKPLTQPFVTEEPISESAPPRQFL